MLRTTTTSEYIASFVTLCVGVLLGGCVINEASPPRSSASCVPFDAQLNEIAAYRFIDKVSGTSEVRITITSNSGPSVSMQIEEDKNTSNVIFDTRCEEGRNKDLVLSKNAAYILGLGVGGSSSSSSSSGEGTGSPAPEVTVIDSQCESESITIAVGTFVAKKCSYSYASGSAVKKTTKYTIDPQQELRPFTYGMLKEITTFADASENSAELIEWNGK